MLVKKIRLENIRSYVKQEINFPEGSTLLAGNIGSGKTSVLLAIDFALFGLRRGNLSGASLLRNGANKGSVELHFNIDNKNIIIKRTLKGNESITQDSGYIIIDNVKKELSPVELKQTILDLLNYPKDMITRSKDLVFRYTVYTPQDEMKQILLSDNELRLETLRKVFGIDRYKNIKDNAKIFISSLKEKKKELLGYTLDLNSKLIEFEIIEKKSREVNEEIIKLAPKIDFINDDIKSKKQELEKIEQNIKRLNDVRRGIDLNEQRLKDNLVRINENNEKTKRIGNEIELLNQSIKINIDIKEVQKNKINLKEDIRQLEDNLYNVRNIINEARIKINNSNKIIDDISDLNTCPVCRQNVDVEYKNEITNKESSLISHLRLELKDLEAQEKETGSKINENKVKLDDINEIEKEYEINKLRLDAISNKLTEIDSIKEMQKNLKEDIGKINQGNIILFKELENLINVENIHKEKAKEIEKSLNELKAVEIRKNTFEVEKKNFDYNLDRLKEEISKKERKRKDMENLSGIQEWLENYFIKSLEIIENNVMLKVYSDFNSMFQRWFYTLVENEDIKIKLNNDFSPLIEQNNHDIDYLYLSGGEKTAAALAYRLSLNQVINNIISNIKTNDLIILDEPTDGFSDEQLDRIRVVLKELKLKQIIIVSHEPKIETFVDNVIRFKKENHISYVE
ncbi:AAA family ATPase [Candidatus Woesearchaeota archaeon]|nr:AAA family ATPase [Candidatus Woesearchaeota archaeon]